MINKDKTHGDVVMIGKYYEWVISQTCVVHHAMELYTIKKQSKLNDGKYKQRRFRNSDRDSIRKSS